MGFSYADLKALSSIGMVPLHEIFLQGMRIHRVLL